MLDGARGRSAIAGRRPSSRALDHPDAPITDRASARRCDTVLLRRVSLYWWTAVSSGPSGIPTTTTSSPTASSPAASTCSTNRRRGSSGWRIRTCRARTAPISTSTTTSSSGTATSTRVGGHADCHAVPAVAALGVGDMPVSLAAVIFACVGLFFAVLLFLTLLNRFLPGMAGGASRGRRSRCAAWCRSCSAVQRSTRSDHLGYAFLMLALYLLASGCLRSRLVAWRLGLGSLCLGLAFGARRC